MNLVPVYPIVVYDYSQQSFDSLTAEEQVAAAQQKRDGLQAKIRAIQERMERMSASVLLYNKPVLDQINSLQEEIEQLELEKRRLIREQHAEEASNSPEKDEELEGMFDEFYSKFEKAEQERVHEHNKAFEEMAERNSKKNKEAAKLFRKIAMKTHPDRTSDPEMHKLFMAAKQCYIYDDVEGLRGIWEAVAGNRMSALLNRLFKRLQELLSEVKYLEQALRALRDSEEFEILQLFEASKDRVLQATYTQNQMKMQMLMQHRDSLLLAVGREPQRHETPFTQFFF